MKTNVLGNGRNSVCRPCDSQLTVSRLEQMELPTTSRHTGLTLACDIFKTTHFDETPSFSTEDRQFLALMNDEMEQNKDGKWTAPLPFRNDHPRLPNNRSHALKRAIMFDQNLQKNPTKQYHAVEFMRNIFQRGHAELAPPLSAEEECWYLPIFGVYHPHKLDKIRMVFDSSAKYHDMSLNSALLTGPDLTNSLMGVLMRFRIGPVAVTADIEQMFHCFAVSEKHRNFLRFLWYKDNDPQKPLTEYRMCVHVFGNSPSPAVATYGLRWAVLEAEPRFGSDVRGFIDKNFYVDDGLISLSSADQVVNLLHRTKEALRTHGQLRLHKFASNDPVVMQSFEPQDLAKDIVNVDLGREELPTQGSLGLVWDLQLDSFTFRLNLEEKPFTRRGVLSQVNSLYDPLGFVAPIIVQGKLLLREMMVPPSVSWDEPLPEVFLSRWTCWKEALSQLLDLHIPRHHLPFQRSAEQSVIIFTDASEVAIAAVAYLSVKEETGNVHLGFLLGKPKVAPKQATSIPRLELCAAALGVEMAVVIRDQLEIPPDKFFLFTDSMIVMGYIHNTSRRFLTYVANRVHRIIAFSSPNQWNFVPTGVNPADHGTRSTPGFVMSDVWLRGPIEWLSIWRATGAESAATNFSLIHPDDDREIKREIVVNKISTSRATFSTHRFQNFSSWQSLIRGLMFLKRKSRCVKDPRHKASLTDVALFSETETFVIQVVQTEVFSREFACLKEGKPIPRDSRIINLDPWIDVDGILRVGGRIKNANVSLQEKTPIIIPGFHHIARLINLRQHQLVRHQGRHLTEGAVRAAGFWITGCKRLVCSIISNCVKCRRSRGTLSVQKMCDLPAERLTPSPPFTYVGVDCFGPWEVVTRRTRGGSADSKRWAVLFTCMCSRAVHIEVLEQMSTPSFINELRRFFSIRGRAKEFFSDRGSNFIGCVRELGITGVNVEDSQIRTYLQTSGSLWKFNTPYSSHMGGAWERLIGMTRRILNVLLLDARYLKLTHEVLTTFLAEVCSIINNRPIVPVSSDSDSPFILTPNVLLTQKSVDVTEVSMDVNVRSLYTSQWKVVQALADRFWTRWRQEYLQTLQPRKKWEVQSPNVNVGDIVLLKDSDVHRNHWPLGRISHVFPSKDSLVRKVELFVMIDGTKHFYIRHITQIVLLLSV